MARRGSFRNPPAVRRGRGPGSAYPLPVWSGPYGGALENTFRGGIEAGLRPPGRRDLPGRPGAAVIPRPPAGTYDPSLDAQFDAAQRGYGDFRQDTELANSRARQDYGFGRFDINRQATRGREDLATRGSDTVQDYFTQLGDLGQSRGRGMADILRDRSRGTEDFQSSSRRLDEDYGLGTGRLGEDRDRAIQVLDRNYRFMGNRQSGAARAAGVASGGALAQAAAKRAENQAFDRQPIDQAFERGTADLTRGYERQSGDLRQNFGRFGEDSRTAETRLGEDFTRSVTGLNTNAGRTMRDIGTAGTRLGQDQTTGLDRLGVGYQRGVVDRATGLSRAGRENRAFGQDIGAARFYQARGSIGQLPTYSTKPLRAQDPYSKPNRGRLPDWMRRR